MHIPPTHVYPSPSIPMTPYPWIPSVDITPAWIKLPQKTVKSLYLIGSLRNEEIPNVAKRLRTECDLDVFDDWYAAGPEADDYWKSYEECRGRSYKEALSGYAARNVFNFDRNNLDRSDAAMLVLPAGKSGHLELGYMAGKGKPTYILLDRPDQRKLKDGWEWLAGLYEGEGSFGHSNKTKSPRGVNLSITMKDCDVLEKAQKIAGVGNLHGPYKRDNPNWSDMYKWQVTNMSDCLYVLNGITPILGSRRQEQIKEKLLELEVTESEMVNAGSPHELRWDVMYQFATQVFENIEEAIEHLK